MTGPDPLVLAVAIVVEHLDARVVGGWPPARGPLELCSRCREYTATRSPFGIPLHRDCGPALIAADRERRLDAEMRRRWKASR